MRERLGNASHMNVCTLRLTFVCVCALWCVGRCSILIPPPATEVQKKPAAAMTASYITFLLPLHGVLTEHPSTTIYSWASSSLGEMLSLFTAAGVSPFAASALSVRRRRRAERKRCAECVKQHFPGAADLLFLRRHKFFTPAAQLRRFIDGFFRLSWKRRKKFKSACSVKTHLARIHFSRDFFAVKNVK